jgi:hypothetical protein
LKKEKKRKEVERKKENENSVGLHHQVMVRIMIPLE